MPTHRITSEASARIVAGKKAGKSSRAVAQELKDELGIELDQRTISRHVGKIGEQPPPVAPKMPRRPRADEDDDPGFEPHPPATPTLDEVTALETEVSYLQVLLANPLPPRDRTALNAELRQTFASIRMAKKAIKDAQDSEDEDVTWMIAKLKRFAAMNAQTDDAPQPAADDEPGSAPGVVSR